MQVPGTPYLEIFPPSPSKDNVGRREAMGAEELVPSGALCNEVPLTLILALIADLDSLLLSPLALDCLADAALFWRWGGRKGLLGEQGLVSKERMGCWVHFCPPLFWSVCKADRKEGRGRMRG